MSDVEYKISYDQMEDIIKRYYSQKGKSVEISISNGIDNDRFPGTVTTRIQVTEEATIGGAKSESQWYLSMNDLKGIVGEILDQEGKELLNLTNNAVKANKLEGYGMGEHVVESTTGKTFTITAREKRKTL